MKNINKFTLCIILVFLSCAMVFAHDFGIILDQSIGASSEGNRTSSEYLGILIPRFSTLIGDNGYFYASAGFSLEYQDEWLFIPELLRTEFSWQFDNGALTPGYVTLGRMYYSDPLGFAADGLFDGVQYTYDMMDLGLLSAGVWYTGLLYKNRANIIMTERDLDKWSLRLDYRNFIETYFAPNRIFTALDWEPQGNRGLYRLNLSLLAQFDLSKDDFHTQYLVGSLVIPFDFFVLNLGTSFELLHVVDRYKFAFAGTAGAIFELPVRFANELTVSASIASGQFGNPPINAYIPITSRYTGRVLRERFSALTVLSVEYLTLLTPNLSATASSSYFIRNDLYTPFYYGQRDKYFMGGEFYGNLIWSIFSDLQFNLSAGFFLPQLGNSAPHANPVWRIELGAILSIH